MEPQFKATQNMVLLDCLAKLYPDSPRKRLKNVLKEGRVYVAGKLAKIPGLMVATGTLVEVRRERFASRDLPNLRIVHEDEHLLVVDKKEQFLSVATDQEKTKTAFHQVLGYLQQKDPRARLFIVHRLDFGTSGLLLFAKTEEVQEKLKEFFRQHTIERGYKAVVEGHPQPEEGILQDHLAESQTLRVYVTRNKTRGKHAVTHYKVERKGKSCALLDVRLETGRRGQIRVQLAHRGHPIVGDHEHGGSSNALGRFCLHAHRLAFVHPGTGKRVAFESRMPFSFLRALDMPRTALVPPVEWEKHGGKMHEGKKPVHFRGNRR